MSKHDSRCGWRFGGEPCRDFSTDGTRMGAVIAHTMGTTSEEEISDMHSGIPFTSDVDEEQKEWEESLKMNDKELPPGLYPVDGIVDGKPVNPRPFKPWGPDNEETVRRYSLPQGLCSQRGDHEPHEHDSLTLGKFWCTGREFDRQPGKAERKRRENGQVSAEGCRSSQVH